MKIFRCFRRSLLSLQTIHPTPDVRYPTPNSQDAGLSRTRTARQVSVQVVSVNDATGCQTCIAGFRVYAVGFRENLHENLCTGFVRFNLQQSGSTNITMMVRKASPNHHQPLLVIYTQTIYPMNPNHVLFSEWIVRERDEKRLIRGYKFVNEFVQ